MRLMLVLLFIFTFVANVEASFNSIEEVSSWVAHYYRNPEPDRIPDAYHFMSRSGLMDDENAIAPLFGFLAGALNDNPEKANTLIERLSKLPDSHKSILILGVWYSDLNISKQKAYFLIEENELLKKQFDFLFKGDPTTIDKIPLEQGTWVLDALWGNFLATGNSEPVRRIISVLPWSEIKGDIDRLLIGGAAKWSLTSNAELHEKVLQICEDEYRMQPEGIRIFLEEIIKKAKKNKA